MKKSDMENSCPIWLLRMYSEHVINLLVERARENEEACEESEDEETKKWLKIIAQDYWETADAIYFLNRKLGIYD